MREGEMFPWVMVVAALVLLAILAVIQEGRINALEASSACLAVPS